MACSVKRRTHDKRDISVQGRAVISPMVAIVMARLAFDAAAVVLCGAWLFLDWIGTNRLRAMMLVMPGVTAVTRIAPVVTCLAALPWLPFDAATSARPGCRQSIP